MAVSFDYFADDLGPSKSDYSRRGKLRLVWEGQSTTLDNIRTIRDVLNDLRDRIELHVVTDPFLYRFFRRLRTHPSHKLLRDFECDVHFHAWARDSFWKHLVAADLAVIPIDRANRFAMGKPENKLVMLWQLGLPVLTSDTPAYRRAMDAAGLDLLCTGSDDWRAKLEALAGASGDELERIGRQGRSFADHAYSKASFIARFDAAFEAAGFDLDRSR